MENVHKYTKGKCTPIFKGKCTPIYKGKCTQIYKGKVYKESVQGKFTRKVFKESVRCKKNIQGKERCIQKKPKIKNFACIE